MRSLRSRRLQATVIHYEHLEKYLKVLNREDREKHKKRIAAVKELMALWPERTNKTKWITLAKVDASKARAAQKSQTASDAGASG